MSVRFWGVRGSIACPGPATLRYGGNTSCVEVRCGEHILIFDAGTGIKPLGDSLMEADPGAALDIFLSHCHIDHVVGLPFFAPLFSQDRRVNIWAGHLKPPFGVEDAVRKLMSFPLFPVPVEAFQAKLEFRDFKAGETLTPRGDIVIRTVALNHPDGATGYRIEHGGRAVAYVTDTECGDGPLDPALVELARGAALLILDTTYTDRELPAHIGWGHSSWQQGVRLADAADVGTLCLFHHDPDHDDAFMDTIRAEAERARPDTIVATEGALLTI